MSTHPPAQPLTRLQDRHGEIPVVSETFEVPALEFQRLAGLADENALGGARVALRRGRAILLVRTIDAADEWAAPGGEREPGETHAETAVRAAEGETGLDVTLGRPLAAKEVTFEHRHCSEKSVTGLWLWFGGADEGGPVEPDDDAVLSAGWFTEIPDTVDDVAIDPISDWVTEERNRPSVEAAQSADD